MGSPSWEETEFLLQIARDASLGKGFDERFSAISESLLALVPGVSLSAMLLSPEGGQPLADYGFNQAENAMLSYATHYRNFDPMGAGIANANGEPLLLTDVQGDRSIRLPRTRNMGRHHRRGGTRSSRPRSRSAGSPWRRRASRAALAFARTGLPVGSAS